MLAIGWLHDKGGRVAEIERAVRAPAEYGQKVQHAADRIRRRIASGEYRPGMHLRQDEIAYELGQSRVPVREAFKILVTEQLLVHHQNRGHFVAELTAAEMADICWLRESLEAELARSARAPSAETLELLEEINARIQSLQGAERAWERTELDESFHRTLWHLSERPVLIRELQAMATRQRPYRVLMSNELPARDPAAAAEHGEIIAALRERDMRRYQLLLSAHIARARAIVTVLQQRESRDAQREESALAAAAGGAVDHTEPGHIA